MRTLRALFLVSASAFVLSCSAGEEQVVRTYFNAVQGGDEIAAKGVSVVEFPGEVQSWEIVEVGPEFEEPFELVALFERVAERKKELEAAQEENSAFGEANMKLYSEYHQKRDKDPEAELTGKLGEFGAEWDARIEKQKALEADIRALEDDIDALKNEAGLSINSVVTGSYSGAVKGKEVSLKVNDGSADKMYKVVVKRYELADVEKNITPMSRWIITEIHEQA